MKNFSLGFAIALAIACAIVFLGVIPSVKRSAYDKGFAAGNASGTESGIKIGIAKGVEQVRESKVQDSIRIEALNRKASEAAAKKRTNTRTEPVQNWHVIDGKIAEPITRHNDPNM